MKNPRPIWVIAVFAIGVGVTINSAQAVVVQNIPVTFNITNFGGPICELSTNENIITGTDAEFFNLDFYHIGVTDATGTLGINNLGAPNPDQGRAISVGSSIVGQGFIDRANIMDPMFLTIWEGTPSTSNPNISVPGAILTQIPIPQSALTAGPFPCVPINAAPISDAGNDQNNIIPGFTVTLDGNASSDPDNDRLTFNWVQISGPAVTLSGANSVNPTFTAPAEASNTPIVFQLIVNDGLVNSSTDTVSFTFQDNVAAARNSIANFLAERALLLLSQQPDIQRRIDRLQGRTSKGGGTIVGGVFLPGSEKLPIRANAGESNNNISPFGTYVDQFDTNRSLLSVTLTGEFSIGKGVLIRPEAEVVYLKETQKSYTDTLGSFIASQSSDFGQLRAAPRIMYNVQISDNFSIRPFAEAQAIYPFGDGFRGNFNSDTRLRIEGGIDLISTAGFRASVGGFYDGIGSSNFKAQGANLNIAFTF